MSTNYSRHTAHHQEPITALAASGFSYVEGCWTLVDIVRQCLTMSTNSSRHTTHHQEPKTALAASGFSYVEGCWTCSWWTLSSSAWQCPPTPRDTPPIIRSLKLHWQPLVFHKWKVVGHVVGGRCQALPDNVHQLHRHCLTTSTNYTSNNLPRMKTQRLPVQF